MRATGVQDGKTPTRIFSAGLLYFTRVSGYSNAKTASWLTGDMHISEIEDDVLAVEETNAVSLEAQSFWEFYHYSRIALPILVDQAIIHAEMAPIEERVRVFIVNIIRSCQSTVTSTF